MGHQLLPSNPCCCMCRHRPIQLILWECVWPAGATTMCRHRPTQLTLWEFVWPAGATTKEPASEHSLLPFWEWVWSASVAKGQWHWPLPLHLWKHPCGLLLLQLPPSVQWECADLCPVSLGAYETHNHCCLQPNGNHWPRPSSRRRSHKPQPPPSQTPSLTTSWLQGVLLNTLLHTSWTPSWAGTQLQEWSWTTAVLITCSWCVWELPHVPRTPGPGTSHLIFTSIVNSIMVNTGWGKRQKAPILKIALPLRRKSWNLTTQLQKLRIYASTSGLLNPALVE